MEDNSLLKIKIKKIWIKPELKVIDISDITLQGATGTGIDGGIFS
ncbi:MAG: hypothetical protein U0354_14265 [Candidatus Sericytochromatia bacterium]